MNAGPLLRDARLSAGLTQAALAVRSATSQAAVSAYESGRKEPSAGTLGRLLAAAGWRLAATRAERPVVTVTDGQLARAGRRLVEVVELAEALPSRHQPELRYPRLTVRRA